MINPIFWNRGDAVAVLIERAAADADGFGGNVDLVGLAGFQHALRLCDLPENLSEALRDSSVVVASYDIGDNMRGLVGVVGPTRMDYATVAARLSYFAESLGRMFGKNQLPPKEDQET